MPRRCTHTIFPGSSKLGVVSSVCSTAVSWNSEAVSQSATCSTNLLWASWGAVMLERKINKKCVPLADLFNLLLWGGWNGLPPTPDTLHLGCSYHLHSSHCFLSTWGVVRLVHKIKKGTQIVPPTCLPSNQLQKYTPIILTAHNLLNPKSLYFYSLPHSQPLTGLVATCSTEWGRGMRLAVLAESVLHKLVTSFRPEGIY